MNETRGDCCQDESSGSAVRMPGRLAAAATAAAASAAAAAVAGGTKDDNLALQLEDDTS